METSNSRLRRLGVLWAVYGVGRVVMVVVLAVFSGTATVMFGALLSRAPNPFALMADFHLLYVIMIAWTMASGILALVAAADLLSRRGSARAIANLAAFLALPDLPFGIMLGVYTLVVLARPDRSNL
ncbi:MAG: hypothetical protein WB987_18490 [Candidatus Acidiferrales bacterium]